MLGVPAQFEQLDYAIRLIPPWLGIRQSGRTRTTERPVITEGLPTLYPDPFSVSGVAQTLTISGQSDRTTQTQGSFSSVGTALGGSWYFQAQQPSLSNADSWRLSEFQYLRQTDTTDIALGSQPTFWPSQGSTQSSSTQNSSAQSNRNSSQGNNYWGATYIQRWGFEPHEASGTNGFNPRGRLQAAEVGRSVTGGRS